MTEPVHAKKRSRLGMVALFLLGSLLYAELLIQPACGTTTPGSADATVNPVADASVPADAFRPADAGLPPDSATDSGVDSGDQCSIKPGTYTCVATKYTDPAGHRKFLGDVFPQTITVGFQAPTMTCTGQYPFVDVSGACPGTLSGKAALLDIPNVTCEMRNMTPVGNGWTASYVMGAMGELPQGQPMTIDISCN